MTASIESDLQDLGRQRPEWEPWLAVIQEVLRETANAQWDGFVPAAIEARESKVPLLAGAVIALETTWLRRWTDQLIRTASRSGTEKMASLKRAIRKPADPLRLFEASLRLDDSAPKQIAVNCGVDPDAFHAVAALLPVPFLHACNRRWAHSIPQGWVEGYCPVCGAWPAVAEVRGIDRSRYFRCGRCAGEWQVNCLVCAFCGMTDHEQLVIAGAGARRHHARDRSLQALSWIRQNFHHPPGQSGRQGDARRSRQRGSRYRGRGAWLQTSPRTRLQPRRHGRR